MKPDRRGEAAPIRKKTARPTRVPQPPSATGQDEQEQEDDHGEDAEGSELPPQVGRRTLLDRLRDLAHLRRALVGGQDGLDQVRGEAEGGQGDDEDDGDQRHVPAGQRTVGHVFLQASTAAGRRRCSRVGGGAIRRAAELHDRNARSVREVTGCASERDAVFLPPARSQEISYTCAVAARV